MSQNDCHVAIRRCVITADMISAAVTSLVCDWFVHQARVGAARAIAHPLHTSDLCDVRLGRECDAFGGVAFVLWLVGAELEVEVAAERASVISLAFHVSVSYSAFDSIPADTLRAGLQ